MRQELRDLSSLKTNMAQEQHRIYREDSVLDHFTKRGTTRIDPKLTFLQSGPAPQRKSKERLHRYDELLEDCVPTLPPLTR